MIPSGLAAPFAVGAALAWAAVGGRLLLPVQREAAESSCPIAPEKAVAIYLFYRTGEPLIATAPGRGLPIEAEQLEGLLCVVGNFVETSTDAFPGYTTTAMVYDDLGILAARGRHMIAAAVHEGPACEGLREELLRTVRAFESRRGRDLGSFEGAMRTAEQAAEELSKLFHRKAPRAARPQATLRVPGAYAR